MNSKYLLLTFSIVLISGMSAVFAAHHEMSPKAQYDSGVPLHEIHCKDSYSLEIKATTMSPVCIKQTSVERLVNLGWALGEQDKNALLDESQSVDENTSQENVEIDDAVEVEVESAENTEKKSFKIELKEQVTVKGN